LSDAGEAPRSAPVAALRYRSRLAYVGTFFHGWQIQENASRTVQSVVERALAGILGQPTRVMAAGRTDAGVHADGQVIHFDGRRMPPEGLLAAVNARLPWDVKFLEVEETSPDFHARFDARAKTYRYVFSRAPVISPREALFAAKLSARADVSRMAAAGAALLGEHDFGPFATSGTEVSSTVRHLLRCDLSEQGPRVVLTLEASGFLRGMARAIAGLLAWIGRGLAPPELAAEILQTGDRNKLPAKARARGLTLVAVSYWEPKGPFAGGVAAPGGLEEEV
jgi:tRNA pseudouridine38-40 synthase